jgi:hypothetical protein
MHISIRILACRKYVAQYDAFARCKEMGATGIPVAPRLDGHSLENKLSAELQGARAVVAGHGSKVPVMGTRIDALKLSVVEGVEGLESQFNSRSFMAGERDGFEQ